MKRASRLAISTADFALHPSPFVNFPSMRISLESIAMTNKQILQADLLDILFENRNKAYGAYALRKTYASRLKWAVGISLSFSMLLLFFSFSGSKNEDPPVDKTKGMELSVLALAPNEPRKPGGSPKPRIKPQVAQTSFVNRIRLVANNVQPSVPSIKDLESTIISDVNAKGVQPGDIPESSNNRRVGNGVDEKENEPQKPLAARQSEAEFPGGREAFARFLKRYLITPNDLEAGDKKMVVIRFMVDADGTISRAEIIQSDGEQYSTEVLRVLRKMPKWIPATQNGTKVSAWFTQPVTFIGIDQ